MNCLFSIVAKLKDGVVPAGPELMKRMVDIMDEIIPMMPVNDRMSRLITHVAGCMLEATVEGQISYEQLMAVATRASCLQQTPNIDNEVTAHESGARLECAQRPRSNESRCIEG
jgi:hypothetical protein